MNVSSTQSVATFRVEEIRKRLTPCQAAARASARGSRRELVNFSTVRRLAAAACVSFLVISTNAANP
jgi:hypothetical protein